ncbi:zf-B_box domain-containing protein [Cephalotus follicularis]|uniref:Zf-B_box domain-containing protein n=1 Tax=Cephalotus follicularis TaxID=3775 RepID=A0A1Q3CMI6_CEPFO|nr:zf-B_box domain-containing protein [Cephalotus follicularis]
MCRGIEERNQGAGFCSKDDATNCWVCCELCGSKAILYCQADDAFLCRKCDKRVHGANFLAYRHIRCLLCNTCQNLTQRYLLGASLVVLLPTIVGLSERSQCDLDYETKCSTLHKMPFLFL